MNRAHDLAMHLRSAYLSMHRQSDGAIREFSLTSDQFVLLQLISENKGITQKRLVQLATSDPNTVSAMLQLLESRGLVKRTMHPEDRRARSVRLTDLGKSTLLELRKANREVRTNLLKLFTAQESDLLVELLSRIARTGAIDSDSSQEQVPSPEPPSLPKRSKKRVVQTK